MNLIFILKRSQLTYGLLRFEKYQFQFFKLLAFPTTKVISSLPGKVSSRLPASDMLQNENGKVRECMKKLTSLAGELIFL